MSQLIYISHEIKRFNGSIVDIRRKFYMNWIHLADHLDSVPIGLLDFRFPFESYAN